MWIDWLDLTKLTSLRTDGIYSSTFHNPRHITLESDSHSLWMMFRHAQSHRCVSLKWCIRLQEWRHNHRKHSLHPSLTNRHRGSSALLQVITERWMNALCATHPVHHCVRAHHLCAKTSLTQWPFQSQVKSIIQNRWNSRSSSFSKTIWNRYISHSVVTCIPFCHNRKRFVSSPFTLISASVLVWITSQMAFVRDCGYNQFRWVSWVMRLCHRSSLICCYTSFKHCIFHFVANQWFILCGTKQVWWVASDRYGKRLCVLTSSRVVMVCILVVGDNSTSSMKK